MYVVCLCHTFWPISLASLFAFFSFLIRLSLCHQVKGLQATLTQMSEMVSKMKRDREASAKQVNQLQASFQTVLKKIRTQPLTKQQVGAGWSSVH